MKNNLVSKIIEIKTNSLDAYVSKYFESHLSEKKDILTCFQKHKSLLKVDACIWALVFALDGKHFDELIIDDYSYYEIAKDLRLIAATDALNSWVSKSCVIRIGLSKEVRCIYQLGINIIQNALIFAEDVDKDELVSVFKRVIETQMYLGKPLFKNFSIAYINEEMNLLKAIIQTSKALTFPPTLVFYALHDFVLAKILIEEQNCDTSHLQTDIATILGDQNIKTQYLRVPGLFTIGIRDIGSTALDPNFSFDDILYAITAGKYFDCKSSSFRKLISYVYNKYPSRFEEFEDVLLHYVNQNAFFIKYHSILYLVLLEAELRKFKNSQIFKNAIINLYIACDLFSEFKQRKSSFKKGLKIVLRTYNVEFDYIVNLVSQVIDDEDEDEIVEFNAFKNLFE